MIKASFILMFTAFSPFCHAASGAGTGSDSIAAYYIDISPPEVAANKMLGLEDDKVSHPSSTKGLSIELGRLFQGGTLNPNIGIEVSPNNLLSKDVNDYRENFWWRSWQISMATGQSDSNKTKAAFGLRWIPVDRGNPMQDKSYQLEQHAIAHQDAIRRFNRYRCPAP